MQMEVHDPAVAHQHGFDARDLTVVDRTIHCCI
jgi:hypothetical protein